MNKLFSVDAVFETRIRQSIKISATSAAEAHVQAASLAGVASVEACREVAQPAREDLQWLAAKNICDAFARQGYTAVSAAVEKALPLLPASPSDSSGEKVLRSLCSAFKAKGFLGFGSIARSAQAFLVPSVV